AAATALHVWGTVHPRASYYLPVHWRLAKGSPDVALTFDDGPHPEHTPAALDLLAAHGHRATFFVIGEHARRHPHLLKRMRAEGHAIGLHSQGHSRWFNCWPPRLVMRDLVACGASIADATGEPPPRLFRPPVGLKNPLVGEAARRLALVTVTWTERAWDRPGYGAERIAARLETAATPRAILMLHDGHEPGRTVDRSPSIAALGRLLPALRARGLLSRALRADGSTLGVEPG
nr:polysaccharide deacetylase family protein [Planctomycetota bacterium]